jgi:predicted PurR-regulated permease PerM
MKVTVDVETKTVVRVLLGVSVFVGLVFLVWRLWPAIILVLVAGLLALALNPPVSILASRLPGKNRALATAIAFLVVLGVLGTFIYVAVPPVVDQTNKFIQNLPVYVQDLSEKRGLVSDFINHYGLQDQLNQFVVGAQQQVGNIVQGIGSSVVNGVASVLTGIITLITIIVLTFLMLIEGPRWMDRVWNLYTDDDRLARHQRLANKMYKVVSGFVNGQVLVAAIAAAIGLATLLILTSIFSVPVSAVIPLTGLIFITELIPLIGPPIGVLIACIVLLFNDPGAALAYLIYYVIYLQIEGNFIQPLVQSRTVALSALAIIVALIFGITILGLVGGILAIPLAGCIRVLLLDYMEHRKHKAEAHKKKGLLARLATKA